MFWIAHPAVDEAPVGLVRWLKWHISEWMEAKARKWNREALYPDEPCECCGYPRRKGDHSRCDEIPF